MSTERATTDIAAVRNRLQATFDSGRSTEIVWRRQQLQGVIDLLEKHEDDLLDALAADLGKPRFDAWLTDLLTTRDEARHALKHLASWIKPTRQPVPVMAQPGRAWTEPQPLGLILLIAPWNYPVQLLLSPLVDALAAGIRAVQKVFA